MYRKSLVTISHYTFKYFSLFSLTFEIIICLITLPFLPSVSFRFFFYILFLLYPPPTSFSSVWSSSRLVCYIHISIHSTLCFKIFFCLLFYISHIFPYVFQYIYEDNLNFLGKFLVLGRPATLKGRSAGSSKTQ